MGVAARVVSSFTPPGEAHTPTDAQWEAISTTDQHLLVSASAGTGKTTTVVDKVLYLLGVPVRGETREPALTLDQVAAITYTNKAAAELKEKIRTGLRGAGRRAQAAEVDTARIGTIHSFCGDILREFALRGGFSPRMALVTELESLELRAECIRETLIAELEGSGGAEETLGLDQLLEVYSLKDVEWWVRQLLDQGDALGSLVARAPEMGVEERGLVLFAERVRQRIEHRLKGEGQVDFDRMITWTRDLIRDDESVRRALQRRIRVLIIDEFQDVDPAQREIAYLLGEPETKRPDTTRLVFVGDPKQSIYRFRRADVRVWRSVERDFVERGWGRVVALADNRRSVPGLLGFVDHALGAVLDTPADAAKGHQDFEVLYSPVVPVRPDGDWPHAVEVLAVPADANGKPYKAEVNRLSDAAAVARRAYELHESGVEWRDMAVLLCAWEALDLYQAALQAAGVPTYALRSEGFYGRPEIVDLVVALRAIRDPSDDRALVGFLRGPCVGVSDETLLRVARRLYPPYAPALRRVEIPDEGERQRLHAGIGLLERLAAVRDRVPLRALVERLLDESGYLAHLALLWGTNSQQIANVRKFLRQLDGLRNVSLTDVLEAITEARALNVEEGDARLHGERDDVVTITSVHMAKGLEWRVVFWCDLVRGLKPFAEKLVIAGDAVALVPAGGDDHSPAAVQYAALKTQAMAERGAEVKRLWYVAATRAKDLLVLGGIPLGTGGRGADSPGHAMRDALGDMGIPGGRVPYAAHSGRAFEALVQRVRVVEEEVSAARVGSLGAAAALPGPLPVIPVPRSRTRHSATELMALERCGKRHWFKYVLGVREPVVGGGGGGGGEEGEPSAIERGLIIHDVLERYEEELELDALLEDAIGRWDEDAPPPEAPRGVRYRQSLATEIDGVLANPEYRAVFDQPNARRELPFLYIRALDWYADGKIDLVGSGQNGYEVIDVKTGQCSRAAAAGKAESYGIQRSLYVQVLQAIGGRPVDQFGFHFTRPNVQVGAQLTDGARERQERDLRATILRLAADPPALTEHAAECWACGFKRVGWCAGVRR